MIPNLTQHVSRTIALSPRQQQIVDILLTDGKTNKEIAGIMKVGEQTIKNQMRLIMNKTGCSTRTELVVRMLRRAA
jgi:DNA-binding NarL/FixJ family response regulator